MEFDILNLVISITKLIFVIILYHYTHLPYLCTNVYISVLIQELGPQLNLLLFPYMIREGGIF